MAAALGLNLITPPSFLKAISEGTDPSAADKATIDAQITGKQIKVYVYNSQNSTPDVTRQVEEAKKAGIPVSTVMSRRGVVMGPPEQVITAETLSALYGTPIEVLRDHAGGLVVVGHQDLPSQQLPRPRHAP